MKRGTQVSNCHMPPLYATVAYILTMDKGPCGIIICACRVLIMYIEFLVCDILHCRVVAQY